MIPRLRTSLLLLACALPLSAQEIQINQNNRTIAITTSDEAVALADTAQVQIGFQSYGRDEKGLYADAANISNAIVKTLTDAGLSKGAIESTGQNLRPLSVNSEDDKSRYAEGMRFGFAQSWRVTAPADQAARVLQLAISAGANNSGEIAWQLKDDQALEAQAAVKALKHAREIATTMAQGLGAKLGALIYAGNQAPTDGREPNMLFGVPPGNATAMLEKSSRLQNSPLAIAPERISRSATVYAVFAIE